jgi:3-hydroxypropanoate dehydrogenase
MTSHAVSDEALDIIFRNARTQNKWQNKPVSSAHLMALYDLMRWGPTSANCSPARILFLTSQAAKDRLKPYLAPLNQEKTMGASAVTIIGMDLDFADKLPHLFPNNPKMKDIFASNEELNRATAFRNSSLQGGYFIVAARALGLDCGPMSGFDSQGVDKEFFAGTNIKANFICAIGYGDPAGVFPRNPRLSFDEACKIL